MKINFFMMKKGGPEWITIRDALNAPIEDEHKDLIDFCIAGLSPKYQYSKSHPHALGLTIDTSDMVSSDKVDKLLKEYGNLQTNKVVTTLDWDSLPVLEWEYYISKDNYLIEQVDMILSRQGLDFHANIWTIDELLNPTHDTLKLHDRELLDEINHILKQLSVTKRDKITVPYDPTLVEDGDIIYPVLNLDALVPPKNKRSLYSEIQLNFIARDFPRKLDLISPIPPEPATCETHKLVAGLDIVEDKVPLPDLEDYFVFEVGDYRLPPLNNGFPGIEDFRIYIQPEFSQYLPDTFILTPLNKYKFHIKDRAKLEKCLLQQCTLYVPGKGKPFLKLDSKYFNNPLDGMIDFKKYTLNF